MSKTTVRKSKTAASEKAQPGSLHPVNKPIVVELTFDPNKNPLGIEKYNRLNRLTPIGYDNMTLPNENAH